jgi:hypothetical protein
MKIRLKDPVQQEFATKITLVGVFLSLFAAFISRLSVWRKEQREFSIKPFDLTLLGLATFRLGRLVSYDRVTEPFRHPFTETVPDSTGAGETVVPRGNGIRQTIGQLLSCPICSGTWIAAGLVYGLVSLPNATRVFLAIMGTTGLVEIVNAFTEALSWTGQLARKLAGEKQSRLANHNIHSGGDYYVGHDHEKHYRQSRS